MLNELLQCAVGRGASDLHLTVGVPPVLRIDGELAAADYPVLLSDDTQTLLVALTDDRQRRVFAAQGELDYSLGVDGVGRFRVHVFRQQGCVAIALRILRGQVPDLADLQLPALLTVLTRKTSGLIIVTGPTGSGKSTTLAGMVNAVNEERACHILTLEDPIEYIHTHKNSVVNQRAIHEDAPSFAAALRAGLRADPDVILLGEMRDAETVATALIAAETGHLVLATLHTHDAVQAVDRIIDVFPGVQQAQIRTQLSSVLQGVVAQQLLARSEGGGRVAATEILVVTPAVRNLIRENKTHQIFSLIQTGSKFGMISMDESLKQLYRRGLVRYEDALSRATSPEAFEQLIK